MIDTIYTKEEVQIRTKEVLRKMKKEEQVEFQKVYDKYIVTDKDSINIEFDGTTVPITNLDSIGLRVLRTLFNNTKDLMLNVPDLNFENYLFMKRKGENMFFYAHKPNLASLYKLRDYILDNFEKSKPLTFKDIAEDEILNEEVKAICFSSNNLNISEYLQKVDTYVSKVNNYKDKPIVYDLFKGEITIGRIDVPVTYVRTYDASTDRMFHLQVYNVIEKAIDAPACLVRIREKLKPHLVSILRQGEEYIFEYDISENTKEFKEKSKSKRVYLSGEEYFKFLKYET